MLGTDLFGFPLSLLFPFKLLLLLHYELPLGILLLQVPPHVNLLLLHSLLMLYGLHFLPLLSLPRQLVLDPCALLL
jgi:hypothetical protein